MKFEILKCSFSHRLFFDLDRSIIYWMNTRLWDLVHTELILHSTPSQLISIRFKMKGKISTPQYEVRVFDIDTPLRDAIPVLQEVLEKFGVYLVNVAVELNLPPSGDVILCFSDEPLSHNQLRRLYLIDNL